MIWDNWDTTAWVAANTPCGSEYVIWFDIDPVLDMDAVPLSVDSPAFYRTVAGDAGPVAVTVTNFGTDATYDFFYNI